MIIILTFGGTNNIFVDRMRKNETERERIYFD